MLSKIKKKRSKLIRFDKNMKKIGELVEDMEENGIEDGRLYFETRES